MHSTNAQSGAGFEKNKDPETGAILYRGLFSFHELSELASFGLQEHAMSYQPDTSIIRELKPLLDSCSLVIYLGTWCSDSRYLIPKLYKVLMAFNYPVDKIPVYGLDRDKTSGTGLELRDQVVLVPTIIVYHGAQELGRIVETLRSDRIENDLLELVKRP
jgi:hypothetical protein